MNIKLQTYKKTFDHSYSFGPYATIELLLHRPEHLKHIIIHSKSATNEGVQKILGYAKKHKISVETNDGLLRNLSGKENTYVIGVFSKYACPLLKNENHLVLVSPTNTGNLGTMVRTMLGFSVKNLAIIGPAVDIFDPAVIRASMGAVFSIRHQYFHDFSEYQHSFSNHLYAFMTDGSDQLQDTNFATPFSLIFGNESEGLPKKFHSLAQTVQIPQSLDIDSLNLAVSVGIGLFKSYTQISK